LEKLWVGVMALDKYVLRGRGFVETLAVMKVVDDRLRAFESDTLRRQSAWPGWNVLEAFS
jgi:hypothetical protein